MVKQLQDFPGTKYNQNEELCNSILAFLGTSGFLWALWRAVWCSVVVEPGGRGAGRGGANQKILSQPGRADYAHHITTHPPHLQIFRPSVISDYSVVCASVTNPIGFWKKNHLALLVSAAKKHYSAKTDFLLFYNKFKIILKSHLKFILFLMQNFWFFLSIDWRFRLQIYFQKLERHVKGIATLEK